MEIREIRAQRTHECEEGERLRRATRDAEDAGADEALWGPAVTHVVFAAGEWWAHNEEYSSRIRYCPWCGATLSRGSTR